MGISLQRLHLIIGYLWLACHHPCFAATPTQEPSYEPTLGPNSTDAPSISAVPTITPFPTPEPTLNITRNGTRAPSTLIPSEGPTPTPSISLPPVTDGPSEVPSLVPTETKTFKPTKKPTRKPSAEPTTLEPTPGPTNKVNEPTRPPPTGTPQPTTGGVTRTATLKNVVAEFGGVGELSQQEIADALAVTEVWFMQSFNNKSYTSSERRRYLQQQGSGLNPSQSGVRNMRTQLKYQNSQVNSNGLKLTYDQDLQWTESVASYDPSTLAAMPYNYDPTNRKYASVLSQQVGGFENVNSPIALPDFPASPTSAPSSAPAPSGGGSPLSTGAIVGIAVAGAVGLPLLLYGLYSLCCAAGGSDKDSSRPGGSSGGYISAGSAPPSKVVTSRDDVSTMDYPRLEDRESMADYQDQSVATVDYDYSKAYGGGADASVVSSAGGTMGDNTRQTAGDVVTTAAARAALGASFDSEGGFREEESSNVKEEIIEINAPAGKLGVVIDTPDDGAPVVHAVKDSSVIANLICVGDKLIAVDDEDVRSMTAIKVSKLISKKSMNPSRKLTIVRTTYIDDSEG